MDDDRDVDNDLDEVYLDEDLEGAQDDSLADDPDYDDLVAFEDLDPKTISYDSDNDDCESIIHDKEALEVVNEGAVTVEAHSEEGEPFHGFLPSLDEQDDLEEDEDTRVRRCDDRISNVAHSFHKKAEACPGIPSKTCVDEYRLPATTEKVESRDCDRYFFWI